MLNITSREMKINTIMGYHLTLVRMVITKKPTNNKCGDHSVGGNVNWWECKYGEQHG